MEEYKKLLEIRGLSVESSSGLILDRLDLSVDENEAVGIVGESGAGKTITALAALGLLPEGIRRTAGSVLFRGREVSGISSLDAGLLRGRKIGMIFQEPSTYLNPVFTAGFQAAEATVYRSEAGRAEAREKTASLFRKLGLDPGETLDRYPFELSGGQKQRVMIAMAMMSAPELLIADEPTTALDPEVQLQILGLLKMVRDEFRTSLLFITHDIEAVGRVADRIAVMSGGRVVECGRTKDILNSPVHEYTKRLIDSSGRSGARISGPGAAGGAAVPGKELLTAEGLKVHFPVRKGFFRRVSHFIPAVDGVDIAVREGETVALVGPSGCGKTTLGKAMVGLNVISAGHIRMEGEDITHTKLKKSVAIVFQDPYASLNPRLMIRDIIIEGLPCFRPGMTREEIESDLLEILRLVGLETGVLSRFPHEFSGGQRQRIALARALILKPRVVILDEVTSSLDATIKAQILRLLKDIQEKTGVAYLHITHDMSTVASFADRVYVMQAGRITAAGSSAEICAGFAGGVYNISGNAVFPNA